MHVAIETFQASKMRVAAVALLCPCAALVLFLIAAGLTDGDTPRTFAEWFVSIAGSVLVLPAVVLARVVSVDEHLILFWMFWLLSGIFWAVVIESFITAKNARRP